MLPCDLISLARTIKPKSTEGHDGISNKIMKLSIEEISVPLSHVFNLSMSSGVVPRQMKIAKVTPIHKNGNHQILANYRPISILPALSKLLEKVVYSRLYRFLENNDLLFNDQYGFRKKHSTMHPILKLLKHTTDSNDTRTKDITVATFLDLSKAFDSVSHNILLYKLNYYGIRGIANEWFKDYLTGRQQYTEANNVLSDIKDIECGVPQGSILGPLLFLIYVNDLEKSTTLPILTLADDTTILASGNNIDDVTVKLNSELRNVANWLSHNRLLLNIDKSRFMVLAPPNTRTSTNSIVHINNISVKRVSKSNPGDKSVKFLGLHLDENLTWQYHIEEE